MQTIHLETKIAAPLERCFLLSTSVDLHIATAARTREQAIDGVTRGLIGLGQSVTWQGRHFGLMLTHQSIISAYDLPHHFRDEMLRGCFRTFTHDHFFEPTAEGTLMRDRLVFSVPFGPIGVIAEHWPLHAHLTHFLQRRNAALRSIAEGNVWQTYLR